MTSDRTPTNDNATAGLVADLMKDHQTMCRLARLDPSVSVTSASCAADTITALQARVAEAEAERDWFAVTVVNLSSQRDAALSREKEAKAEGMREAADICDQMETRTNRPSRCAKAIRASAAALAQSGGADPAQGKGDIATTALAYLVNAQHDLRTGWDPARTLATLSAGVAAVEAGMAGGGA